MTEEVKSVSGQNKEDWMPYTYLVGWPEHNRWYYGVRYARNCHPRDLWHGYFTSSRSVNEFAKIHGEPIIKEIRKTFDSSVTARAWENRVLKKLKVVKKEEWLNKTDNMSILPMYGLNNPACDPLVKSKISTSVKLWYQTNTNPRIGASTSTETREKQSKAKLGKLNPFYKKHHLEKNIELFSNNQKGSSNSFYGKKHSIETKKHLSLIRTGVAKLTTQCPHCGKIGSVNTMPRWHFNNCKKLNYVI